MSRLHRRASALATPLPHQRRFSHSTFSGPPRIRLWSPQATIRLRSGPRAGKIRTLRTTSWSYPPCPPRPAHIHRRVLAHVPWAITILRSKPSSSAGDCAPGEDVAQAQNCVDGYRATAEKSRRGARVMHYARRVWKKQPRKNRMLVEMGRALFHHASAALDGSPQGIPRHDWQQSESYYQWGVSHPPSISFI
ncbi:hypothetical protein B0H14DRAFT_3469037 [Mycena olivaceomarginata]|nr:hypothetical protein B0H14DRAFT_3469037 [Mycena olivaceomarginata]